ncbi:MAG: hypothetical protein ACTSXV_02175 [Alphaproteobacteria bacterium]
MKKMKFSFIMLLITISTLIYSCEANDPIMNDTDKIALKNDSINDTMIKDIENIEKELKDKEEELKKFRENSKYQNEK